MNEYFAQLSAVEAEREREHQAAVQIQRLFRGFRTRRRLRKLQYDTSERSSSHGRNDARCEFHHVGCGLSLSGGGSV